MPKFQKGDRVSFVGDPASGDTTEGTVMQFLPGTFNKYEVHADRGGVLHLAENELEELDEPTTKKKGGK